jgi:S1-C subfamily serine protease
VRAFDGDGASYSYATGFVVDAKAGIILTNRHVVAPGPVLADAIFVNKEEVALQAIYRDPVHDFGFYRFDPKALKYIEINEIPLRPEDARVGVDIRVVGNDAGEKMSILSGTLARLDRDAPNYGQNAYNDFNTFYYAAASSTSGGSSGSPILTIEGRAIALNAGGAKKAASSYYLPLDRIVRALKCLQDYGLDTACQGNGDDRVPRGTLQTIFKHTAFDEARRLGLRTESEEQVREAFPDETGMLVVDQVILQGPADGQLEPGDILINLNDRLLTTFVPMEEIYDESVDKEVVLKVERGGKEIVLNLKVGDLHAISPSCFLEVSSAIIHPLSYQQARNHNLPVGGAFMAQTGHMLLRAGIQHQCIFTSIGSKETTNLDEFESVLAALPDGTRTQVYFAPPNSHPPTHPPHHRSPPFLLQFVFPSLCLQIRYYLLRDRHRIRVGIITVDRTWFPMQRYTRAKSGLWNPKPSPPPPLKTEESVEGRSAAPIALDGANETAQKIFPGTSP